MPKYTIDLNKSYRIPSEVKVVGIKDRYLVIAPVIAGWIVLENNSQLSIFDCFRNGLSICDVLSKSEFKKEEVNYVVTQIEARRFYERIMKNSTDKKRALHLYLTNRCNLICPHCYMFSGKPLENELSTEEIKGLIIDYKTIAGGKDITFSGGEPFVRADIGELVSFCAEKGLRVKVLTNGTIGKRDILNDIVRNLDSVQISIDGYSEESNRLIRGGGNFRKALDSVNFFLENGVPVSIAITPPITLLRDHLNDYLLFAEQLNKQYYEKPLHIKFSEELLDGRSIKLSQEERVEYFTSMQKLQSFLYGPDYDVISFVRTMDPDCIIESCMFGVLAVNANGDVFPCARIGDLSPMANIRTTPFRAIYEKSLEAERAALVTNLRPCKECELRFICGGGCRIEEFPSLVERTSFNDICFDSIPARSCKQSVKDKFYDLMVRSNQYLYSPLSQ